MAVPRRRSLIQLALTLLLALLIAYGIQRFVVGVFRVPTDSMSRTLLPGDRLLAARFWYSIERPKRGDIVVLHPNADPDHLARIVDVPVTLSGLSEHNTANALAATAAALGLGLPRQAVVDGLRTFAPDPTHNPGRMNVYTLPLAAGGRVTVIIDLAHNEAGL